MCNKRLDVWLRWLHLKTIPWQQLSFATYELLQFPDRDQAKSRLLISLTKFNLIGIYEILEDLIRFPPY